MIEEKEKKLTELLERQGISKKDYFFSWLFTYLFIIIIPVITYIFLYSLLYPIHILLFSLNMILFSLSLYLFTYFIYICISRSQTGSILIKLINFGPCILGFVLTFCNFNKLKIIVALIPQINIYYCFNCIEKLIKFKNLSKELISLEANNISFKESIIMYLFDIIFYSLLSIFISKYKQSGLGFFQFLMSFCKSVPRKINKKRENKNDLKVLNFEKHFQDLSPFNQKRKAQDDCLRIVNVTKNFDSLIAVDNFSGDLFGNEIFCLLGHNGAGKSTLINIISGILDPTEGDIFYKGKSLVTNKDYLFENIGICQQEDIFFEYLTVSEHLKYMCEIKGSKANNEEIKSLIKSIGLEEKSNSLCNTLSGGQKRKLCTALALIGNSNIILLDEPTSGMDPISRKALWEFLKNYQRNKIILVTTHSLEEAEYLGDRIGIMSDGQFICCGTSSFLKSKYPCGFNINLLINSDKFSEEKKKNFLEEIKSYEPNAQIRIASKSVLSLNIQSNNEYISDIFSFIEELKNYYDIEDYTVASTSLEDIFLKINNQSNLNEMKYINKKMGSQEILIPENLIEISNCFVQFICQLKRNFLPIYRNILILIIEYLTSLGIIYFLFICFPKLYEAVNRSCLNLLKVLESNQVYIYQDSSAQGVLEDSYAYDLTSMTLKTLSKKPNSVQNLIDLAYDVSSANIAIGCISINQIGDKWNTYVSSLNIGNLYANTMLVVSSFLKKEFGINAIIFNEIKNREIFGINADKRIILFSLCIGSLFGYISFLGGLINEKIKERKTNIKHLLYLSGSNPWSYWMAFFIIDYLKLLIFSFLLIIPFWVMEIGGYKGFKIYYFLLNFLVANATSLIFIYFISFFGSNPKSGIKFLFLLIIVFWIIFYLVSFLFLIRNDVDSYYEGVIKTKDDIMNDYFTIFDLTPITSMLSSFYRIFIAFIYFQYFGILYNSYIFQGYFAQAINFVFYFLLLILMESGYLRNFFNWIKLKFCLSKNNDDFSENKLNDEFLLDELNTSKINTPLIQDENKDQLFYDSNKYTIKRNSLSKTNLNYDVRNGNPDVIKEKYKLDKRNDFTTRIEGLYKTFWLCCRKNVRAINNLNLGLELNEKFGLLGINGSGKTTTFKVITNEILYD